jgi:hypothetical protein
MTAHIKVWLFRDCRPTNLPIVFGLCSQLLMFKMLLPITVIGQFSMILLADNSLLP